MNFKKYHVSKNLAPPLTDWISGYVDTNGNIHNASGIVQEKSSDYLSIESDTDYVFAFETGTFPTGSSGYWSAVGLYDENKAFIRRDAGSQPGTPRVFHTDNDAAYIRLSYRSYGSTLNTMLNIGSEPLPYEPYSSEVWHSTPHYIHNTSTDTLATLPAVLYPNDTAATVGLKGQMLQSSVPSPISPVMPQGTGDLETVGTKAGQYKIPILSNSTTTNVYLGEVQTTRKIKKLVLDGTGGSITASGRYRLTVSDKINITPICTHYKGSNVTSYTELNDGEVTMGISSYLTIYDSNCTTLDEYQTYLQQQYAAGTPVTIWYVLAEPTTGIVNEPIRKIGDYADEVSGIKIPTIAGVNTLSVDTTLQPSEVTATYKGWHPVADVHERSGGQWD